MDSIDSKRDYLYGHLPEVVYISASDVPEPYNHLLVHDGDMTGRLERFYHQAIHLETLNSERKENYLFRRVLLKTEKKETVEFGAIRIHLDAFTGEPLARVLGCKQPLGGILTSFKIPFECRLHGFFKISGEEASLNFFQTGGNKVLFGRKNHLVKPDGQPIADVVEILPSTALKL